MEIFLLLPLEFPQNLDTLKKNLIRSHYPTYVSIIAGWALSILIQSSGKTIMASRRLMFREDPFSIHWEFHPCLAIWLPCCSEHGTYRYATTWQKLTSEHCSQACMWMQNKIRKHTSHLGRLESVFSQRSTTKEQIWDLYLL